MNKMDIESQNEVNEHEIPKNNNRDRILSILKNILHKYGAITLFTISALLYLTGFIYIVISRRDAALEFFEELNKTRASVDKELYDKYYFGDSCMKNIEFQIVKEFTKIVEIQVFTPENSTEIKEIKKHIDYLKDIQLNYPSVNETVAKFNQDLSDILESKGSVGYLVKSIFISFCSFMLVSIIISSIDTMFSCSTVTPDNEYSTMLIVCTTYIFLLASYPCLYFILDASFHRYYNDEEPLLPQKCPVSIVL